MNIFTRITIAEYFQEMLQDKSEKIHLEILSNNPAKHFSKSLKIEFAIDIFFLI
jgi:hypothetical protein